MAPKSLLNAIGMLCVSKKVQVRCSVDSPQGVHCCANVLRREDGSEVIIKCNRNALCLKEGETSVIESECMALTFVIQAQSDTYLRKKDWPCMCCKMAN